MKQMKTANFCKSNPIVLKNYPDVMDVEQMCQILSVSTKTGYKLLNEGKIPCLKVGRSFRIPKVDLMKYLRSK